MQIEIDIGTAQPKQVEFLTATTKFVGYGGSRGGGKSWAVRTKAKYLALKNAGIRILILRRTYPELEENHIKQLKKELPKEIVRYSEQKKLFTFVNGSEIKLGYCQNNGDLDNFQGQEYDVIFMDEATHFTEHMFKTLTACLRGVNNFPKRFYITCNPGGIGHNWVKRLFIDKEYTATENAKDYTFIQAKVYDNLILMEKDPEYVKTLEALPEKQRKAWLYGDWNIFDGQYYSEWNYYLHTCAPFEIPKHWNRFTAMDYGLDMLAHYQFAINEEGNIFVTNEIYKSGQIVSEAIDLVKKQETDAPLCRYAPPDLWNSQSATGKSTAILFSEMGFELTRANNDRESGWLAIHELLKIVNGKPKLQIFRNCVNLIRTLPQLQFDDKRPNDCANEPHEVTHAPDALRYFANSYTYAAAPLPKKITWFDKIGNLENENEIEEFWQ